MFSPVSPYNSVELQQRLLDYWDEQQIFARSVALHPEREKVFYDGPPFPTGSPHHGTVLVSVLKDLVARYWTMRGFSVPRRWGWDCHGLPIETQAEQLCGITEKTEILQRIGLANFNNACRTIVGNYNEAWRTYIREVGRWVDYDNAYRTMDTDYMESVLWAFQACYEKGLIYQDYRVTPYCTRCETSLSISDTRESDSTRPRLDPAIVVRFKLDTTINGKPAYILAWTTTPWTLPSNLALGVSPDARYAFVDVGDAVYLLGRSALPRYARLLGAFPLIIEECAGRELAGLSYEPIYAYFVRCKDDGKAFRILAVDFVAEEEGVGVVHQAPAFGEDDYWACKAAGIPVICPVDARGRFTGEVPEYAGRHVLDANREIMEELHRRGVLLDQQTIEHNYPHCWRCQTPLIYRAMDAWYLAVEKIKSALLRENERIHWVPESVKHGRFGHWLRQARDWNISRNRFWGTLIPVWVCDRCGTREVLGSRQAIAERWGQEVTDLHTEVVDGVVFPCVCGGMYRRVPEVLDGWFESGAMPYAQVHYPFENRDWFTQHFPADFIIEYTGQLRCWFYYLHVLAVALFDRPAFAHCVVHGTILAKDGKKISKSRKNYTDPMVLMHTHGTDALRLYLLQSNAAVMGELLFDDAGVKAMVQQVLLPLWNAYAFFVTYAGLDNWSPAQQTPSTSEDPLDRWILARLYDTAERITSCLDAYQLDAYAAPLFAFVDDLTNWYIRRSRRRFWSEGMDPAKAQAYQTLYTVLITYARLLAPLAPFISEEIYRNLTGEDSVHLAPWPRIDHALSDEGIIARTAIMRKIITLGLSLRAQQHLKVRQPLSKVECALPPGDAALLTPDDLALVADELNIKHVLLVQDPESIAELRFLPDLKRLGPLLGSDMPAVAGAIRAGQFNSEDATLRIVVGERTWTIERDSVLTHYEGKAGRTIASDGGMVVSLDTELNQELREEGLARELVRTVQDMRKQAGYAITDRIALDISATLPTQWREYIASETLAEYRAIAVADCQRSINENGEKITVRIALR